MFGEIDWVCLKKLLDCICYNVGSGPVRFRSLESLELCLYKKCNAILYILVCIFKKF